MSYIITLSRLICLKFVDTKAVIRLRKSNRQCSVMLLCIVSFRLPDKQWLFMVSQHSHWILMLLSNETSPLHKQQNIVHYSWFIPYTYEFNSLSVNVLWQQSYNSYSQQFHQCQQTKMSPVTSNYCAQTRPRRLTLEIQLLAWYISIIYQHFNDACICYISDSICRRRVWRYQRGNQNPYIEEEQTAQWPKEKVQKDKQRSTKHTYKTKGRETRTPLKTWGELRCSGRVSSSCSTSDTRRVNLETNPVISHERRISVSLGSMYHKSQLLTCRK